MKKLLLLTLLCGVTLIYALTPFRIYNPTIMQRAGLDSLSITINDSDSVNITTSKAFVSYNKPLKVNGDSLPTITRVKELIADSLQTITGFVDLTSEQTITGIKTFSDIYASSVESDMLISNNIYNSDGNLFLYTDDTSIYLKSPYNKNIIKSTYLDQYSKYIVEYAGADNSELIQSISQSDGDTTYVVYKNAYGSPLVESYADYITDTYYQYIRSKDGKTLITDILDSTQNRLTYYNPLGYKLIDYLYENENVNYITYYGINDEAIISSNYSNNEKLITYKSALDNIIYSNINESTFENDFRIYDGVGTALITSTNDETTYYGNSAALIGTNENETTYFGLNTNLITTNIYGVIYYGYDGLDFISYNPTTTTISRGDTVLLSQTKDLVKYNGVNSESLIEATDTTLTIYNPRINAPMLEYTIDNRFLLKGYNNNDFIEQDQEFTKILGNEGNNFIDYSNTITTISRGDTIFIEMADTTIRAQKNLVAPKFYVSALNEAPASATAEGTTGEIRITTNYIYVCVSDDVWVRTELTTWP